MAQPTGRDRDRFDEDKEQVLEVLRHIRHFLEDKFRVFEDQFREVKVSVKDLSDKTSGREGLWAAHSQIAAVSKRVDKAEEEVDVIAGRCSALKDELARTHLIITEKNWRLWAALIASAVGGGTVGTLLSRLIQ